MLGSIARVGEDAKLVLSSDLGCLVKHGYGTIGLTLAQQQFALAPERIRDLGRYRNLASDRDEFRGRNVCRCEVAAGLFDPLDNPVAVHLAGPRTAASGHGRHFVQMRQRLGQCTTLDGMVRKHAQRPVQVGCETMDSSVLRG